MRLCCGALAFAFIFVGDAMSPAFDGIDGAMQAVSYIAFEQITVDNTSGGKAFTASKITPQSGGLQATQAVCRLESNEIRYTVDTTPPTTTVGTLLEPGDTLTVNGHDLLVNFRAIRTGASSGILSCTYSAP